MAENRNENPNQQVRPLKKADLIIRYERDLSLKAEDILKQVKTAGENVNAADAKIQSVIDKLGIDNTDVHQEIQRVLIQGDAEKRDEIPRNAKREHFHLGFRKS